MLMSLSPAERLAMCCRMLDTAKTLVVAGLPDTLRADPIEVRVQLFLRFYGCDFDEAERSRICAQLRAHGNRRLPPTPKHG